MDSVINLLQSIIDDMEAERDRIFEAMYETMNTHDYKSGYAEGKRNTLEDQIGVLEKAIEAVRQRY